MEFYTIGVYNSTEQEFYEKILDNKIDFFCDIRQRRGVRGAKYSFVNSKKLQDKLLQLNISYQHIKELAPTTNIRELQKEADKIVGEVKRDRSKIGQVFSDTYQKEILSSFNFNEFISNLEKDESKRIVFFCVEEKAEACHRSIVTNRLKEMKYKITHL